MPTYTYECKKCASRHDVFHGMTESPKLKCGTCGARALHKIIGSGAGIIFKGSGFYETDYKRAGKTAESGEGKTAEAKSENGAAKDAGAAAKDTGAATKPADKKSATAAAN